MKTPTVQARAVGNAVYLEHIGERGDIAVWGENDPEKAKFVAEQINKLLDMVRAEGSRDAIGTATS